MTFINAIQAAPADADFVAYRNIGGWVVIQRRSDGIWDSCATLTSQGYSIFCSGLSAQHKSLWSFEARQFITGTVDQLSKEN